jgi:hypothetical protein
MMLAIRKLLVRAKTDMKAKSAQASTCRAIGSVNAQVGRKNTTASARPRAAGNAISVIVPP